MSPTITVIRSIGAEFAKRLFVPVAVTGIIVSTVLVTGVFLLATLSEWWLLLLIPVVMIVSVIFGVLAVSWLVIRTVQPQQTKAQRKAVGSYVDKLQRVSEAVQTPKFVLFFRVLRDVSAPRKDGFIGSMTDDTVSLKRDFTDLQKLFQ
jgi:hypothetical protein